MDRRGFDYRACKFIAFRPLDQSARRWLNIVAIGLRSATHGTMADGVTKTVCGFVATSAIPKLKAERFG